MEQTIDQGIGYSLSILRENDYPKVLFWLGVKPLNFEDLQELLSDVSINRLITIVKDLQNRYLISPIQQAGCFVLTTGGQELTRLVTSLGVWGRQQMDDSADMTSDQIVEPEANASMEELIKYNEKLDKYL